MLKPRIAIPLILLALLAAMPLAGCASCGASDGWERFYNPLCVR